MFQDSERSNWGWIIKSVSASGRDYTTTPIDLSVSLSDVVVTFTNAPGSITGAVHDRAGATASDSAVIAFPVEPEQWQRYGWNPRRIRTALASTAGTFAVRPLPAGEYYVVAVPATEVAAWQTPGFFARAAAAATRVSIAWGEQKTAAVRLADIR